MATLRMFAALGMSALLVMSCAGGDVDETTDPAKDAKDDAAPVLGKADSQMAILETGRFGQQGEAAGEVDGVSLQSYRINGFGNTRIKVWLRSPGIEMDPYLAIDGPIPSTEPTIIAYNDDGPGDTLDSYLEITLEKPGAYRLLVGSYGTWRQDSNDNGRYTLEYECVEACQMPQITLADLVSGLTAQMGQEGAITALTGAMEQFLPAGSANAQAGEAMLAQVQAYLANPAGTEAFPWVPLDLTDTAQGFFESEAAAGEPPGAVHFDVSEILTKGCAPARAELKPVDAERLPGLQTGSIADYTIDDCTLERAQAFADVLNNLALENGSTVTHDGQTFESVEAVFSALIAADHHVVVTNDRFFADFLGLYYNGAAVVAPLWLDTGIPLADGSGTLRLPSPHTHHTISVTGPLVNAKIMYYMGVSAGVSFRAVGNMRSPWTGLKTHYTYDSATDAPAVIRLMTTAGKLRKKWAAEAAGLPAEGYGTLGVCNDSTAILEYSEEQSVSIFPLAHGETEWDPADEIDQILKELPGDAHGYDSAEAFGRVLNTLPFAIDALPFPALKTQLNALVGQTAGVD